MCLFRLEVHQGEAPAVELAGAAVVLGGLSNDNNNNNNNMCTYIYIYIYIYYPVGTHHYYHYSCYHHHYY